MPDSLRKDLKRELEAPAFEVRIRRAVESDGALVFIVSDEDGEFARAGRITDALKYASDLLHGPGTGPRGSIWRMMGAMEDGRA